nr:sugar ABC transporter substrate-binding protein [Phaeacidiphilus oryzae]
MLGVLGVLGAALALLLTACGGAADSVRAHGPVHITFWSALRGSQQVVDEFNRTHSDVKVDFEQIPSGASGGYTKLSNAARAGNAPDVATIEYPELPGYVIDGVARDLDPLIPAGTKEKFQPAALDLTSFGGHTYSLPLDIEPMVFYYRKDLFAKYHLTVPTTWAGFRATAEQLRKAAPKARLASFFPNQMGEIAGLSWQAGAQWFGTAHDTWQLSMDDAPTRRVAGYWQRLLDRDLVRVEGQSSQQWTAGIQSGDTVGYIDGAWAAGALMKSDPPGKGRWAVAPLPQWDPAHPADGTEGGSTFTVTKDSRHPRQAMEFILWQTTDPDALKARLSSGTSSAFPAVPALVPVAQHAMDDSYFGGQDIYAQFQRSAATVRPQWMWGPRMLATLSQVQTGLARAAAGSGTIESALRAGQAATLPDLTSVGLSVDSH